MATVETASPAGSLAELLERLGGIAPDRIRLRPPPGTATELDVLQAERGEHRLCELVEGTLVEKAMGFRESLLASALLAFLREFVHAGNLGLVTGADGAIRLYAGLVRIPDVAFVAWGRLPDGRVPDEPIPDLAPDLVVEVLSRGNTRGEIQRKLQEYFTAGVRLAWVVDPATRTITVYTSPKESRKLGEDQVLDGGAVLPGFRLEPARLFAELDRQREP